MTGGMARIALCALALAVTGCREEKDEVTIVEEIAVQDAGYMVPRPDGFDAATFGAELRLTETGNLRAPRDMRIRPARTGDSLTGEVQSRGAVSYMIEDAGAGSGGTLWELTAIKPVGGQTVMIVASVQTESAAPEFDWIWPVIDGIKPSE